MDISDNRLKVEFDSANDYWFTVQIVYDYYSKYVIVIFESCSNILVYHDLCTNCKS